MEIIAAVLIFIIASCALAIIIGLWIVYLLFLVALVVFLVGGFAALILFGIVVFVGNLAWAIYKHNREKHRLILAELNRLDDEPV